MAEYVYALGLAGERISVTEIDKTIEYTYDELYRLVSEKITDSKGNVKEYTYAYDDVSNRILKTENGVETVYTYNALNQLISENDTTYEYDNAGNLVRTIAPTKSALYEYNAENKLIKATVQDGISVTVEQYTYDFAGNRTSKSTISNGIVEITHYLNDISGGLTQVLAELDADGDEKCFYTRGFELISQERDGEVSYYLTDGHGSVRQLANENGNITDTYTYDAWGNLTASTGDTANTYLYCGEQFNSTTGLYYLRARYMNPSTGTFTSMDTYQGSTFDPITLHKYLYANANPVMNCDPSGYMSIGEMSATMEARGSLDEAYAAHNAWAIRMGKKILISLRIGTYIGVSVSLLFCEELLDLCSDVLSGQMEVSRKVKDNIIEKAEDRVDDITIPKIPPYYSTEIYFSVKIEKHVSTVYFSAPLSRETAEARVMMGGDVWAVTEKDAVELCSVLGGVLRGPERGKGNGAFSPLHYHSSFGKGHILYGFDIISMAAGTLKFNIGF